MAEPDTPPSLFEWAGGRDAFTGLIDAFYDRVERDELISPLFPGGVSREHRDHVILWWSEVFGGPAEYTEKLGGYHRMVTKHKDLSITQEQRLRAGGINPISIRVQDKPEHIAEDDEDEP